MGVDYNNYKLGTFFEKIKDNKIVLPDFQRGYIWNYEQQKDLLASFLVDLPIGTTLLIMGEKNDFATRAICEQDVVDAQDSCDYLLDGQQRLSTLYNAFNDLYSLEESWLSVWEKLFKNIRVRWFININTSNDFFGYERLIFDQNKILNSEPREIKDLIIFKKIYKTTDVDKWFHPAFVPVENDEEVNDVLKANTIADIAINDFMIPLYEIQLGEKGLHYLILEKLADKREGVLKALLNNNELELKDIFQNINNDNVDVNLEFMKLKVKWVNAVSDFLKNIYSKKVPYMLLHKNEIGRAAAVFEEINKGGTPLSNFDLIVAKAARTEIELQEDNEISFVQFILNILDEEFSVADITSETEKWKASYFTSIKDNIPSKKFQSMFLNSLSIIARENEELSKSLISRSKILSLSPEEVVSNTKKITKAIARTFSFLQFRCGHINEADIAYEYMLIPIVILFSDDNIWNSTEKINKVEAWFWVSIFSGAYRERQDEKFIEDLKLLRAWIKDEDYESETLKIWKDSENNITFEEQKDKILNRVDYSDKKILLLKNKEVLPSKAIKNSILSYILRKPINDFKLNDEDDRKISSFKSATYNIDETLEETTTDVEEILEEAGTDDETSEEVTTKKEILRKVEKHHIIPIGSAKNIGESAKKLRKEKFNILNCPLNFTFISKKANIDISDCSLDDYYSLLNNVQKNHHFLPDLEENKKLKNTTDYEKYLEKRYNQLKNSIIQTVEALLR